MNDDNIALKLADPQFEPRGVKGLVSKNVLLNGVALQVPASAE